ncbi:hypothetical protein GALMADRAFT_245781 [Galerina marginata CBS 339.88]|uniref:F-box domain-containing protein n=1 Tax=Galerina marginata (strain CBS 339.88) TaxID=685588 RepID=A0A067T5K2_GALM3|nr:hypothetical protein GALMADRAFT_245781 [Galerina marginata CBS 339.88]
MYISGPNLSPNSGFTGSTSAILLLPFEIRLLILAHVRQQDIIQVARVCSFWLPPARYLLYRNVHLEADSRHLLLTLSALENKDILARIRTLRLTSSTIQNARTSRYDHWLGHGLSNTWIPMGIFSGMPQLEELTLVGCPFPTFFDQQGFLLIVRTCCPALRSFTYQPNKTTFPESSTTFDIAGLQTAIWYTPYASGLKPQALSLFMASLTTITDLRVLKHNEILPNISTDLSEWHMLLSLRFPVLTSLTFGHLDTQTHHPIMRASELTKFLLAHPLIVNLSLGADLAKGQYMKIASDDSDTDDTSTNLVTKSFLPALRSLSTHQSNIAFLARRRVRSLRRLTHLCVLYTIPFSSSGRLPPSAIADYDAFDRAEGFPAVHSLRVELESAAESDSYRQADEKMAQVINERLARACPEVRKLEWSFQMILDKDELAAFLAPYHNLRSIFAPAQMVQLAKMNYPSDLRPCQHLVDYFSPLASKCPNLKEVYIPDGSIFSSRRREGVRCVITRTFALTLAGERSEGLEIDVIPGCEDSLFTRES